MLFDELMFDKQTVIKLHLYRQLFTLPRKVYNLHFFAEQFSLNYQQITVFLNDIDDELKECDKEVKSLLVGNGKIDLRRLKVGVDDYRYFLLQESIPFLMIQYILNGETLTVEDFCARHNVSRSTISRKVAPLAKFLKRYKLRITYSPIRIVGDEHVIRLTFFYLYWIGVRDCLWPFQKITRQEVREFQKSLDPFFHINHDYIGQKEFDYLIAVPLCRIKNGEYVEDHKEWQTFFKDIKEYSEITLTGLLDLPDNKRQFETSYFLFLSHYIPYYGKKDDEIIQKTMLEFQSEFLDHPLGIMNQKFMDYLEEEILIRTINDFEKRVIFTNIMSISFTYYMTGSPTPDFEVLGAPLYSQSDSHMVLEGKIRQFFDKMFQSTTYGRLRSSKANLLRRYTNLLMPLYVSQVERRKLRIGIAIERNQILLQRLYSFLQSLNFVECEDFVGDSVDGYDLVISTTSMIVKDFPEVHMFYWDIEYGQNELFYLYQYMQQMYLSR